MLLDCDCRINNPFANGDFFKSSSLHYGGTILGFACVNSDFQLFEMLVEAGESVLPQLSAVVSEPVSTRNNSERAF